ncbi:MAG: pyruvate kinase [candidate division WOR-3 bacterium]
MRKTKIIATIGPASEDKEIIKEMVKSGLNIARLNFSHKTQEEAEITFRNLRKVAPSIGIMMDTQGPEVRLGKVKENTELQSGKIVEIVKEEILGDENRLSVDYPSLLNQLEKGDTILIADGKIELKVEEVKESVKCRVIYGGRISSKKSVNVPGKDIGLSAPTPKDLENIEFGAEIGFDFVAVSFVKSADDIRKIKKILENKNSIMQVIAKIEHIKAIENFDEILKVSDAIMIARGDLGVEVPPSDVPLLQKTIIRKCLEEEKPVIVATQMLASMTESPRATRAEVSDVANAVEDGADAVMLSEETAIGKYPIKAVQFMAETVEKMENYLRGRIPEALKSKKCEIADIIAKSVWQASKDLKAKYIIAHTSSGYTARKIAKFRPDTDILAFTDKEEIMRQLNLIWGVTPFLGEFHNHVDEMICSSADFLYKKKLVDKDDIVILTAGEPVAIPGTTNMLEIRSIGSLLEQRKTLFGGK